MASAPSARLATCRSFGDAFGAARFASGQHRALDSFLCCSASAGFNGTDGDSKDCHGAGLCLALVLQLSA